MKRLFLPVMIPWVFSISVSQPFSNGYHYGDKSTKQIDITTSIETEQESRIQSRMKKIQEIWDVKTEASEGGEYLSLFKKIEVSFAKNTVNVRVEFNVREQLQKSAIELISKQVVFCPNRLKKTFENLDTEKIFHWIVYQTKKQYDSYGEELSSKEVNVFSFSVERKAAEKINWKYVDEEYFQTTYLDYVGYAIMNTWRYPPPEKKEAFDQFVQKFIKK